MMRTTLDVDDRVLRAARALAAQRGISLGRAVSELALRGLADPQRATSSTPSGFPLLPRPANAPVITADVVAAHRDDE